MKKWSSHSPENSSDCPIWTPENLQVSPAGLKPMTSSVLCPHQLRNQATNMTVTDQSVGLVCSRERNYEWKKCLWGVVESRRSHPNFFRCSYETITEIIHQMWRSFLKFISQPHFTNISSTHQRNRLGQQIDPLTYEWRDSSVDKNSAPASQKVMGWNPVEDIQNFPGAHMRQSLRLCSKCEDHYFNSSLNHTSQTFLSVVLVYESIAKAR